MKLILASASPRRSELLSIITKKFDVLASDFDENSIVHRGNNSEYVMNIALGKALRTSKFFNSEAIILACDTIVCLKNEVLGKPSNKEDAVRMLNMLSGNKHEVFSGIALYNNVTGKIITDFQSTTVYFSKMSSMQIEDYINTGEAYDKAGAYGIQGKAAIYVEGIEGCYYNVMGLPLSKLVHLFSEMGVNFN